MKVSNTKDSNNEITTNLFHTHFYRCFFLSIAFMHLLLERCITGNVWSSAFCPQTLWDAGRRSQTDLQISRQPAVPPELQLPHFKLVFYLCFGSFGWWDFTVWSFQTLVKPCNPLNDAPEIGTSAKIKTLLKLLLRSISSLICANLINN